MKAQVSTATYSDVTGSLQAQFFVSSSSPGSLFFPLLSFWAGTPSSWAFQCSSHKSSVPIPPPSGVVKRTLKIIWCSRRMKALKSFETAKLGKTRAPRSRGTWCLSVWLETIRKLVSSGELLSLQSLIGEWVGPAHACRRGFSLQDGIN